MSSVVFICNLALSNIGKDNIVSLTEESPEARACNQFYDIARKLILSAYPWSFAGKTAALALVTNDKATDWECAYSKPNDLIKLRHVRPSYTEAENLAATVVDTPTEYGYRHELEGDKIYCNIDPAYGRYTWNLTDPTRFSPLFLIALSWHVSMFISMPLTRDLKVRAGALETAAVMQGKAEMADAAQEQHDSNPATEGGDLVAAR